VDVGIVKAGDDGSAAGIYHLSAVAPITHCFPVAPHEKETPVCHGHSLGKRAIFIQCCDFSVMNDHIRDFRG
jgi:hypothetical protein